MTARQTFVGIVRPGRGRGRLLGFPTANLEVGKEVEQRLENGVFVARVAWGKDSEYGGVVNIGERPTFSEEERSVELHILDFDGDLYGRALEVILLEKLRDERRFSSAERLAAQIEIDVEQARGVLQRAMENNYHTEV